MSVLKMIVADDRHLLCSELHGSDAELVYAALDDPADTLHVFLRGDAVLVRHDLVDEVRPALEVKAQAQAEEVLLIAARELAAEGADVHFRDDQYDDGKYEQDADEDQPSSLSRQACTPREKRRYTMRRRY